MEIWLRAYGHCADGLASPEVVLLARVNGRKLKKDLQVPVALRDVKHAMDESLAGDRRLTSVLDRNKRSRVGNGNSRSVCASTVEFTARGNDRQSMLCFLVSVLQASFLVAQGHIPLIWNDERGAVVKVREAAVRRRKVALPLRPSLSLIAVLHTATKESSVSSSTSGVYEIMLWKFSTNPHDLPAKPWDKSPGRARA